MTNKIMVDKQLAASIINIALKEIHSVVNERHIDQERVKIIHTIVDSMKKIHELIGSYSLNDQENNELTDTDVRIIENFLSTYKK